MTQEIKAGSIVTLRGRVQETERAIDRMVYMVAIETQLALSIPVARFSSLAFLTVENPPEPLRVGDLVRDKLVDKIGLLKAIEAQFGWVAFSGGHPSTVHLSDLERAETS